MKPKKLECLEGIRALSCISVVLCHFRGAFFPNSSLASRLMSTPLFFLYSGNTAVRLMLALSGFVLSYKYFRTEQMEPLQKDAVKRYIRLAIPSAAVVFFTYLLMKFQFMYQVPAAELTGSQNFLGAFNRFEPSLLSCLKEGFFGVFFRGDSGYVGPLWTMSCELLGSYLVFAVLAILHNKRARYCLYVLYLLIFPAYYNYFMLGMAVSDLYVHEEWLNQLLQKSKFGSILLHLLCWAYIGVVPNIDSYKSRELLFCGAMALMFLTVLNHSWLKKLWGNKAGTWIGRHSFSIYLLHWPLIESVSCALFLKMMGAGYKYKIAALLVISLSLAVIIAVSAGFTRFIVEPSARLSDRVAAFILEGRSRREQA